MLDHPGGQFGLTERGGLVEDRPTPTEEERMAGPAEVTIGIVTTARAVARPCPARPRGERQRAWALVDPADVAEALARLYDAPAESERLGRRAHELATSPELSWPAVGERWRRLLAAVTLPLTPARTRRSRTARRRP